MSIEKGVINEVIESNDMRIINIKGSWSFGLSKKYDNVLIPKVGDTIELHTKRVSIIQGVVINGITVFMKTDKELDNEHKEWVKKYKKEKKERFEKNKAQMDADYEALPDVFKQRIDRFRENNKNFRVDYEEYEVFCCKEAVKIVNALHTAEAVKAFKEKEWDKQILSVPNLSDQHSGNTFSASVMLAYLYLEDKTLVPKMHGTLSPLVGSATFGDIKEDA